MSILARGRRHWRRYWGEWTALAGGLAVAVIAHRYVVAYPVLPSLAGAFAGLLLGGAYRWWRRSGGHGSSGRAGGAAYRARMSIRPEDFTVEPGERGEVFLECPRGEWNAEAERLSLGELLTVARAHLAEAHPEASA